MDGCLMLICGEYSSTYGVNTADVNDNTDGA
jgi:hypothetical protein